MIALKRGFSQNSHSISAAYVQTMNRSGDIDSESLPPTVQHKQYNDVWKKKFKFLNQLNDDSLFEWNSDLFVNTKSSYQYYIQFRSILCAVFSSSHCKHMKMT